MSTSTSISASSKSHSPVSTDVSPRLDASTSNDALRLGRRRSASSTTTLSPHSRYVRAKFRTTVDLPSPATALATTTQPIGLSRDANCRFVRRLLKGSRIAAETAALPSCSSAASIAWGMTASKGTPYSAATSSRLRIRRSNRESANASARPSPSEMARAKSASRLGVGANGAPATAGFVCRASRGVAAFVVSSERTVASRLRRCSPVDLPAARLASCARMRARAAFASASSCCLRTRKYSWA